MTLLELLGIGCSIENSLSEKQWKISQLPATKIVVRKELSLNQKNKGVAIEKPLFVDQG